VTTVQTEISVCIIVFGWDLYQKVGSTLILALSISRWIFPSEIKLFHVVAE